MPADRATGVRKKSTAAAWWLAGLLAGAGLVGVFFALPTGGLAQRGAFVLASLTAPALLAWRMAREGLLGARPWVYLLGGTGLYAVATALWGLAPVVTGGDLPFPSGVDAVYFASYGLSATFLVGLLHVRNRRSAEAVRGSAVPLLDAGIFAVATTAIQWPILIGPNLADPAATGLAEAVAVGYPLLTALLVGLVARLAISGGAWSPALWLLLAWAGGELLGDTFYGYLGAAGEFYFGHPLSAAWLVSYVALGTLASRPDLVRLTDADGTVALRGPRMWLPLGAVLLPLGVELFDRQSILLDVVALVGVALVVARLHLLSGDLAEQQRLASDLAVLTRRVEHQSLHDELTGLANRSLFTEQLEQAWAHNQRHGRGLVVLAIDLDGLKYVNDRHGHQAGDHLLVEAGQRMQRAVRDSDTVARVGGDEFAIILPEASLTAAQQVADRVQEELAAPLVIRDDPRILSASIGIAEATGRHGVPEDLLREADAAMYAAKAAGRARSETYVLGLERATSFALAGVVPAEAIAWANYMRGLRHEIAERKLAGDISPSTRAPAGLHRTLEQLLAAIDDLSEDAASATLDLPVQQDLEEFVYHQTAVQHWADALHTQGILTVRRPPAADHFWDQLERHAVPAAS